MKNYIIDPVHGRIELPPWLLPLLIRPEVRRMINIRQLGLKAYTGFPGAVHTRYVHSLGTMHLAGVLRAKLFEREKGSSRIALQTNLKNIDAALKAAGFFHDIGHGPFSHVLDYVTRIELKKDHTQLAVTAVEKCKDILEPQSIPVDLVCRIIMKQNKHRKNDPYPYVKEIIDGSLDVDRMDYLLRDSFHTGLKYGYDMENLMDSIAILGEGNDLSQYQIGLVDSPDAIVIAEHFLYIWRIMYSLVYYSKPTRIAEKMLEKAVLIAVKEDNDFKQRMSNEERFLQLEEAALLLNLQTIGGKPAELVDSILSRKYYHDLFTLDIEEKVLPDHPFKESVDDDSDLVSDILSKKLSEGCEDYAYICDIVTNKGPKNIRIDRKGEHGEPIQLIDKSKVIEAISKLDRTLNIYVQPKEYEENKPDRDKIKQQVMQLIEEWKK